MIAQLSQEERFSRIMDWEGGNLTVQSFIELFSDLIRTGLAWKLQGMYGRQAMALIDSGLLKKDGTITQKAQDEHWGTGEMLYDE